LLGVGVSLVPPVEPVLEVDVNGGLEAEDGVAAFWSPRAIEGGDCTGIAFGVDATVDALRIVAVIEVWLRMVVVA